MPRRYFHWHATTISQPRVKARKTALPVNRQKVEVVVVSSEHRIHVAVFREVASSRGKKVWAAVHHVLKRGRGKIESDGRHACERLQSCEHLVSPHVHHLFPFGKVRWYHRVSVQGRVLGDLGLGADSPEEAPFGVSFWWAKCLWLLFVVKVGNTAAVIAWNLRAFWCYANLIRQFGACVAFSVRGLEITLKEVNKTVVVCFVHAWVFDYKTTKVVQRKRHFINLSFGLWRCWVCHERGEINHRDAITGEGASSFNSCHVR
mmetsp:Transcript_12975/g.21953  ORF Transcript_12975/g.21953 Transcript_12975/m.21953 type:complete len:261 (-) Transcript_12975:30-812(-)